MRLSEEEANKNAEAFLAEVKKLQEKYSMKLNSDTGDVYLSYKSNKGKWSSVKIGWVGDGTGIKVM